MTNIWKILAANLLVDTGPVIALIVRKDRYHRWACSVLDEISGPMLTNTAVVTESFHLLRKTRRGVAVLIQMIEEGYLKVENPYPASVQFIHQQLTKYQDIGASFADVAILAQYESYAEATIFTIDSDFDVYKTSNGNPLNTIKPGF